MSSDGIRLDRVVDHVDRRAPSWLAAVPAAEMRKIGVD